MNDKTFMVLTALGMFLMGIVAYQWGYANGKRKERGYIEELLETYREFYATTMPILLDIHKEGE